MSDEFAIMDDVGASARLAALGGAFFLAGAVMLPALLLNGLYYWAGWLLALIFEPGLNGAGAGQRSAALGRRLGAADCGRNGRPSCWRTEGECR